MDKEKILFIVTNPLVEGKFETKARILGVRLAIARLLPSFVTIPKSIFSLYLVNK